jgi:hypothetical protein
VCHLCRLRTSHLWYCVVLFVCHGAAATCKTHGVTALRTKICSVYVTTRVFTFKTHGRILLQKIIGKCNEAAYKN